MTKQKIKGNYGEEIAKEYLKGKKYILLAENFNCKSGEIDIIAKDKDEKSVLFTLLNEIIGFCRDTTQKDKG